MQKRPVTNKSSQAWGGVTGVAIRGFKSISTEQSIEVRPLTLLAGANNSGKSSIMQPLLLLKQTLEASYDPGALLLDGPNVKFTSANQLLSRKESGGSTTSFSVAVSVGLFDSPGGALTTSFIYRPGKGFEISQMTALRNGEEITLRPQMSHNKLLETFPDVKKTLKSLPEKSRLEVVRNRCFLELQLATSGSDGPPVKRSIMTPGSAAEILVRELIHLPGLRGSPQRTYPVTAVGTSFPGTFQEYISSIISEWQTRNGSNQLVKLGKNLEKLGLTWKVEAEAINDSQVEIKVGRLPRSAGARDLVNIADVGFGVSQTLPVLVALLVATPGQMVYIEEPETHLHPRAQIAMASLLADAANRGVRVVVETHSQLLLLGVQTLVAENRLSPDKVKLHWFKREKGTTKIKSADLDESGAFGKWPEDFAEVALETESRYLDAAESHQLRG